jgi:hypothetical protein
MEGENLEQQLRESIITHLDLCNETDTPAVCSMCGDKEGKRKVIDLVVKLILQSKMDVPDAIVAVEKTFNPNEMD